MRVRVCESTLPESNCRGYPNGNFKPTGLLQDYGEDDTMLFGMITGSYQKNTEGGVLRKRVGTIRDEINSTNGAFLNVNPGIIKTLDGLRIVGFGGNFEYTDASDNCGWIVNGPTTSGRCRMWGNPVGEMMYEAVRYFAGKGAPTAAFDINSSGNPDADLGLSRTTWDNPYANGKPTCAKPFQTVISDINPSYDTDQIPGTAFGSFGGDVAGLNVASLGQQIWDNEFGGPGLHYIGQSGSINNGAPTAKTITSLGNIRGLAPEEPTKLGGYYSASVAYYGVKTDLNPAAGSQRMQTFAVALASPLPKFEISVGTGTVTLVPYAKSVGGSGISNAQGSFQPTNQIVDFYVESITPTSGSFRVNYEDVEQGADHDMDAIVRYTYQVNANNTLTVTMNSLYAAGGIIQHMGYVISGTTADGTYLEVRDRDTAAGSDPDYFLDTPAGGNWADGQPLPLASARTFSPGTQEGATLLKDPLWFAAKWGGFDDGNGDFLPQQEEWDSDNDGKPDNYFLVTNALTLKDQLSKAFDDIVRRSGSVSAAAVNSGTISSDTRIYQSTFSSADWSGNMLALPIDSNGAVAAPTWNAGSKVPASDNRKIATVNGNGVAVPFRWASLNAQRQLALQPADSLGQNRLNYLRGDRSQERRNAGLFRDRNPLSVLGDFINSAPVYVARPPFRYSDSLESGAYTSFRDTNAARTKMLYVGGNDGMLHAIDASTGIEKWAFIPGQVFNNLIQLTSNSYQHRYFVDGSPVMNDVYVGSNWRTVLITPLGQGGQALFAMDVTNPDAATEAAVASKYMWQFSDAQDADLGYVVGRPQVTRTGSGKWVAVFGNGYNNTESDGSVSATGNAVLYIVDISNGQLLKKISTNVGMAADPLGTSRPNGLSTPALVDVNGDGIAESAYAGDLFGNLWKFNLSDANPANWTVSFSNVSSQPAPFFVATDSLNRRQPITSRPQVGVGPLGEGLFVYFGTGKFLELIDRDISTLKPQSFYGLIDRSTGATTDVISGRGVLTQQTIDVERVFTGGDQGSNVRLTSDNAIGTNRGWYLDLLAPGGVFQGEMQVTESLLRNQRIIFTTLIPNSDVCGYGGTSWTMMMDALTGGRLESSFDLNGDGSFSVDDKLAPNTGDTAVAASGRQSQYGISPKPSIVSTGSVEYLLTPGTAENADTGQAGMDAPGTDPGPGAFGRQSWRQLR